MAKQSVTKFPVRHSTNIPAGFIESHQTTVEDEEKIKFVHRINSFLPEKDAAQDELECKQRMCVSTFRSSYAVNLGTHHLLSRMFC